MFGIGLGEIIIIMLIIFLISPKDIPKAMKKLGQLFNTLDNLRDELSNLKDDVNDVVKDSDINIDLQDIDYKTKQKKISRNMRNKTKKNIEK